MLIDYIKSGLLFTATRSVYAQENWVWFFAKNNFERRVVNHMGGDPVEVMAGKVGEFEVIAGVPEKGDSDLNFRFYAAPPSTDEETISTLRRKLHERGADFDFYIVAKGMELNKHASGDDIETELYELASFLSENKFKPVAIDSLDYYIP